MNPRYMAVRDIANIKFAPKHSDKHQSMEQFGMLTFNKGVMEKMLPKKVFQNISDAMEGKAKINPLHADEIAAAMKEWATSHGAVHYCHWFQPLTGHSVEKHDNFYEWKNGGTLIERFSGKNLLRGEPDASSFPSGGLRSTFEARGYTTWDPSTPVFLWKSAHGKVMCIPSVFFSWKGEALDLKIPLLRSDAKIQDASLRLLRHLNIDADSVHSTLGCEQEYFLVDRSLYELRPDLLLCGRTVYGNPPAKGQELEDHYFGSIKERFMGFMQEVEEEAFYLGIPLKTRHAEVAPGQYEFAPIFERSSVAVDHNIMVMELMRQVAPRHGLACLFHEKPFAHINGSGKHNNWALSTDKGLNLLDPTSDPEGNLLFLIVLTAVLSAIDRHSALLRASIASNGNDHRLGGHEAPPVIISAYLGETLERLLESLEKNLPHQAVAQEKYDLGIFSISEIPRDATDRNRTSPFAFTGNKFEFRAVGSSANCSFPLTVLNVIVAESLNKIVDEIEKSLSNKNMESPAVFKQAALPVIQKHIAATKRVRFLGDNYSEEWREEARRRGLPIIERSFDAFFVLQEPKVQHAFEGVLTKLELDSRFHVMTEHYGKVMNVETKLMIELFKTQILPGALEYQRHLAKSIHQAASIEKVDVSSQKRLLQSLSMQINDAIDKVDHLEKERERAMLLEGMERSRAFSHEVFSHFSSVRKAVDALEKVVDDRFWPLPKYRELLFVI